MFLTKILDSNNKGHSIVRMNALKETIFEKVNVDL